MSERVPGFKFGLRVRIMQVEEMEQEGVANRTGTVMNNQRTPSHLVRVSLDVKDDDEEESVEVPADSLMRISVLEKCVFRYTKGGDGQ